MKLSGEQLLPLFHGYLDYSYDEGTSYVHLHRFLRSQRDAYLARGPKTLRRCFASANIYLDVVTDSTRLRLSFYARNASAVSYAGFDLYVDGVFADRRFFRDWRIDEVYFPLPDDGQRHRVTLYLPWSCAVTPGWLELDDDAAFEPVQRAGRGMVFGDSITQGYTTLMPSLSYANTLGRDLDAEIINQGAGGFYFDESTLDPALADYAPEFLVIAYGTNDFSRRVPRGRKGLHRPFSSDFLRKKDLRRSAAVPQRFQRRRPPAGRVLHLRRGAGNAGRALRRLSRHHRSPRDRHSAHSRGLCRGLRPPDGFWPSAHRKEP